jgi:hypothetical protein
MTKRFIIILCLFVGGVSHASVPKLSSAADFNLPLKNPTNCSARASAEKDQATNEANPFRQNQKDGKAIQQADASTATGRRSHQNAH